MAIVFVLVQIVRTTGKLLKLHQKLNNNFKRKARDTSVVNALLGDVRIGGVTRKTEHNNSCYLSHYQSKLLFINLLGTSCISGLYYERLSHLPQPAYMSSDGCARQASTPASITHRSERDLLADNVPGIDVGW